MAKSNVIQLLEKLPTHYAQDSTSNNYRIFNAIATQLTSLETQQSNLVTALFIDTCFGDDLNTLGALFGLIRRAGESDEQFRIRIKLFWSTQVSSATIDAIKAAIAAISDDIDEDDITIEEAADKPLISVIMPFDPALGDVTEEIIEAIETTKAAGVYVNIAFQISEGLSESVTVDDGDTAVITEYTSGFFTADVSWADGPDVSG